MSVAEYIQVQGIREIEHDAGSHNTGRKSELWFVRHSPIVPLTPHGTGAGPTPLNDGLAPAQPRRHVSTIGC